MGYQDSTLELHPAGRANIVFDTLEPSSGYYVNTISLRLNEEEREEIIYSSGMNVYGGMYLSSNWPLVDVEFQVRVWATSRAVAMERARTLKLAVTNDLGGMLKFQPPDATRATFYHYLKSSIPKLAKETDNLWDGITRHIQAEGEIYEYGFDVILKTLPAATSDPDNLTALTLSRATLDNTHQPSSLFNFFDTDSSEIEGDLPAHLYFTLQNVQTATAEQIGRVYLTARSAYYSALPYVAQVYEAEDATVISQVDHWSTTALATRSGGGYATCNPPGSANTYEQVLRFALANETHHRGRISVIACVKSDSGNYEAWEAVIRYRAASDTIMQSTEAKILETWGLWHIINCGELQFPPTNIDDTETLSPELDLVLTRNAGVLNDSISVDFIALFFLDEPTIQFDIDVGIDENEELLSYVDGQGDKVAHIVNSATNAINRVVDRHHGDSGLLAMPDFDTRIFVFFERIFANPLIEEDFEAYEGQFWLPVAQFESDEDWLPYGYGRTSLRYYIEGEQSWGYDDGDKVSNYELPTALDLALDNRFQDSDYVCVVVYIEDTTRLTVATDPVRVQFVTNVNEDRSEDVDHYYEISWAQGGLSNDFNFLYAKKNSATKVGNPDWADITRINIAFGIQTTPALIAYDNLYLSIADPDDATVPNPTGASWNFQPTGSTWCITKDDPDDSSNAILACTDKTEDDTEKTALSSITVPDDIRGYCRILVMDLEGGKAGFVFNCTDQTSGSEDMGACVIDYIHRELEFLVYTAGTPAVIAEREVGERMFLTEMGYLNRWYYLGFEISGNTYKFYLTNTAPASTTWAGKLAEVCAASNLVMEEFYAGLTGGSIGFLSLNALIRFDDLYVEYNNTRHVPADQVTVAASALFRTTVPFTD